MQEVSFEQQLLAVFLIMQRFRGVTQGNHLYVNAIEQEIQGFRRHVY